MHKITGEATFGITGASQEVASFTEADSKDLAALAAGKVCI
ncbi:hypothetical protein MIDIC_40004 [Alphaproteobacteria bacterium]